MPTQQRRLLASLVLSSLAAMLVAAGELISSRA
jgi:hypothetical protein